MKDWGYKRRRKHIPNKDKGDHPFKLKALCGLSVKFKDQFDEPANCQWCLKKALKN